MITKEPALIQTLASAFAGAAFVFALLGMVSVSLLAFVLVSERAQKAELATQVKVHDRLEAGRK